MEKTRDICITREERDLSLLLATDEEAIKMYSMEQEIRNHFAPINNVYELKRVQQAYRECTNRDAFVKVYEDACLLYDKLRNEGQYNLNVELFPIVKGCSDICDYFKK